MYVQLTLLASDLWISEESLRTRTHRLMLVHLTECIFAARISGEHTGVPALAVDACLVFGALIVVIATDQHRGRLGR